MARRNQAVLLGVAVVVGVAAVVWPLIGAGSALAVLAWCLQGLPRGRRTLRYSRSIGIARPPAEVLAFVADPVRMGELMAPEFYPAENASLGSRDGSPRFGVLGTEVVARRPDRVEYRQLTAWRDGRVLEFTVVEDVDERAGTATIVADAGGRAVDRLRVRAAADGASSELTFSTELVAPFWAGGMEVALLRGAEEARAGERLGRLLERVRGRLEESVAG